MFYKLELYLTCGSLLLFPAALCWPSGAPSGACSNLTPKHRAAPQNTAAPYKIEIAKMDESTFEVTLDRASTKSSPFRGFLIQVIINYLFSC